MFAETSARNHPPAVLLHPPPPYYDSLTGICQKQEMTGEETGMHHIYFNLEFHNECSFSPQPNLI